MTHTTTPLLITNLRDLRRGDTVEVSRTKDERTTTFRARVQGVASWGAVELRIPDPRGGEREHWIGDTREVARYGITQTVTLLAPA